MATKYNHVQIGVVDEYGNVNVLYPKTASTDVTIDTSGTNIPSTAKTVQLLALAMGKLAFLDTQIDDTSSISTTKTWSAKKIQTSFSDISKTVDHISNTVWNARLMNVTNISDDTGTTMKLMDEETDMSVLNYPGYYRIDMVGCTEDYSPYACSSFMVYFKTSGKWITTLYEGSHSKTPILYFSSVGSDGNCFLKVRLKSYEFATTVRYIVSSFGMIN